MNEKKIAILKPFDYRKENNQFLKEKLYDYEFSPVVAYGIDMGEGIAYEQCQNMDEYQNKLAASRETSLKTIKAIKVEHSIQIIEGEKFFALTPNEYASEKILDKEYLAFVENELGVDSIAVGIPHQGVFYAVSSKGKLKFKLAGLAKQNFENPQANPITPHIFEILNQQIIGVGGENIGEFKKTNVSKSGKGDYFVEVSALNFDVFSEEVSQGYTQAMLLAMTDKDFSGSIIFEQSNESFIFTSEVIQHCNSYVNHVNNNELIQTVNKTLTGNSIEIIFQQNGKKINLGTLGNKTSKETKPWWKIW